MLPGERHAILAMVRSTEDEAEVAMAELLHAEGWDDVTFLEWKLLDVPFLSEDRLVTACYVSAMTSDGGTLVYAEPVEDLDAGFAGPH